MKLISVAIAYVLGSAAAFAPRPSVSRPAMSLNIIDPNQLADLTADAARVLFQECDNAGCTMVDGIKDGSGWHLTGELSSQETDARVLMIETMDTE